MTTDLPDNGRNLDWPQFEAITCHFSPEFIDVYREFEIELPKLFITLQDAIAISSIEEAARLAHQIKGSAANFGFIGTSYAMNELEKEAKDRLLHRAEGYLVLAKQAFQKAQLEVNQRLTQ